MIQRVILMLLNNTSLFNMLRELGFSKDNLQQMSPENERYVK